MLHVLQPREKTVSLKLVCLFSRYVLIGKIKIQIGEWVETTGY